MANKHTPGPWAIEREMFNTSYKGAGITIMGSNDIFVATIEDTASFDNDENEANARLIAASPELLEVVKMLLDEYNDGDVALHTPIAFSKVINRAEEVLAKATGEKEEV